jgi:hypothetical protein
LNPPHQGFACFPFCSTGPNCTNPGVCGTYQQCDQGGCNKLAPAGPDCFTTLCDGTTSYDFSNNPLPPDFFFPGSPPFGGVVDLGGPGGFPGDTIIDRLGDMCFDVPGIVQSIPIEMVQLDLKSCAPIDVGGQLFDVYVTLDPDNPSPPGTLNAIKTHPDGGTYNATLPVNALLLFVPAGGPPPPPGLAWPAPIVLQTVADGTWLQTCCNTGCNSTGFFPGWDIDPGNPTQPCCKPTCHDAGPGHPPGHLHCTTPPDCQPCPQQGPDGACCDHVNGCLGNMPEQDCLALGGNWDPAGDCNDPIWQCPLECFWDNGPPLDDFGAPASQYEWVYPFSAEAADDFILKGDPANWCQLFGVTTWVTHFGFPAGAAPDPGIWKGVTVTIYANASPKAPGGNRRDDGTFIEYFPGGLVYTVFVPNGGYGWFPVPLPCIGDTNGDGITETFQLDIPIDVKLPKNVKFWLVIQPEMSDFLANGQTAILLSQVNHEHPAQQIFPIAGIPAWQNITGNVGPPPVGLCPNAPPAGTRTDLAFVLFGEKIPEPTGACCFISLGFPVCVETTQDDCVINLGGNWLGPQTECPTENVRTATHNGVVVVHVTDPSQNCGSQNRGGGCPANPTDPWTTAGAGTMSYEFGAGPEAPDIPADFFDPGSDPFSGIVGLEGVPLGGPYDPADTLVERSDDPFNRCDLPSATEVTVDTEIVALSLAGTSPITVTYNGGMNPEDWDVEVGLSAVTPPAGSITAVKTHCNGGTYTSELNVQPKFTFTRQSDSAVRVLDTGLEGIDHVTLVQPPNPGDPDPPWTSDLSETLLIPFKECSDFHAAIEDTAQTTSCDCNSNGVRDDCDTAESIVSAGSCLTHNATEWCLDIPDDGVEPRLSGVQKLDIDWSGAVSAASMGVSVSCIDNDGFPVAYGGTATVTPGAGNLVHVALSDPLPDKTCCTLSLDDCVSSGSRKVRSLAGDVSLDGSVTVSDKSLIKGKIGATVDASNFQFDITVDGSISVSDKSLVKPKIGNAAPVCP